MFDKVSFDVDELLFSTMFGHPEHPEFKMVMKAAFDLNVLLEEKGSTERCVVTIMPPFSSSVSIGDCLVWDSEYRGDFGEEFTVEGALKTYKENLIHLLGMFGTKYDATGPCRGRAEELVVMDDPCPECPEGGCGGSRPCNDPPMSSQ